MTRFSPIVDGWVGLGIRDLYVHDNVGGFDCKPVGGRCQPDAVVATTAFSDPQCQSSLDLAYVAQPACGASPRFAVTGDQRVLAIGAPYRQPLYLGKGSLDLPCVEAPTVAGEEPHVLGAEVQLGAVVEAALR